MTSVEDLREKIRELQGRLPTPRVTKPAPVYLPGYRVPTNARAIEYRGRNVETGPNMPDDWKDVEIYRIEVLAIEQGPDRVIHW